MLKSVSVIFMSFLMIIALGGMSFAQTVDTEAYVNGVEGIKAASAPPPGMYLKVYGVYATGDTLKDPDGKEVEGVDLDATVMAIVPRFVWITNFKLLGADYGAEVLVPFVKKSIKMNTPYGPYDESQTGLGDIIVDPLVLAWHGAQWDAIIAAGAFLPFGKYDKEDPMTSPGQDMWTYLFTLGGTYFFDSTRLFSASILARYEIHGEKSDLKVTSGNDFHFEWGLGYTVAQTWDIGIAGYYQMQVTDDSDGADLPGYQNDSVYAIGPQVQNFFPSAGLFASLLVTKEMGAVNRPEVLKVCISVTKIL